MMIQLQCDQVAHSGRQAHSKHLPLVSQIAQMFHSTSYSEVFPQDQHYTRKWLLFLQVQFLLNQIKKSSSSVFISAVTETIQQRGGQESDTEYFATLMTTLEGFEMSEDKLGATVSLLGMVIKRVPSSVLKKEFSPVAKRFLDILGAYLESDNAVLIRSLIGCVGVLLRNQDASVWAFSSTIQVYDALLTFATHKKPQVRKAAQHAVW